MHPLRALAIVAIMAGILGSLGFTLYAGRQNSSILLVTIFAFWVVAPLAALMIGSLVFRMFSDWLLVVVGFTSLAVYGLAALRPLKTTAAAPFLMIPVATWALLGVAAWFRKRRVKP